MGAKLADGRFVVRRCLGAGGSGTVFEAFGNRLQGFVAIKVLNNIGAEAIYSIKEEFRALTDVVHPNVVGLHELFMEGGKWFFTMDLIAGDEFLEAARRSSPASAVSESARSGQALRTVAAP